MVKVCHMTSAHPPFDQRIFLKECVSLARNGYDVTLVERGENCEKDGVHIVGVSMPTGGRLSRMTGFAKKVYKAALAVDADVYHFHDPELLPYGVKLKKLGKKVIFDSHEFYVEQIRTKEYLPAPVTALISKCYDRYQRYVLKRIDGVIITCLRNGINTFENLCVHTAIINNSPILEEFYAAYDPKIEKYPRSCCCTGALTYARGITHLVKAAARADATVYLAGLFSPPEYEQEIMAMPESEHVRYVGKLSRSGVCDLIQHCQVGVACGLNVGQYNKLDVLATKTCEYMELAVPTVIAKCAYHEKLCQKYDMGLCVDAENINEFAGAIRRLIEEPETAVRMGKNGRRAVQEEFNWAIEEKKLLALYEQILKE